MLILINNYLLRNMKDLKGFLMNLRKTIKRFLLSKDFSFEVKEDNFQLNFVLQKDEVLITILGDEKKFSIQNIRDFCFSLYNVMYYFFIYVKVTSVNYTKHEIKQTFKILKNNNSYNHLKYSFDGVTADRVAVIIKKRRRRNSIADETL